MNDGLYKPVCVSVPFDPPPPLSFFLKNKHQPGSLRGFNQHPNSSQEM